MVLARRKGRRGWEKWAKRGKMGASVIVSTMKVKKKIYIKEKERGEKGIWNMEQYPGVEKKECRFWESDVLHFNLAFATSSK